MLRLHLALPPHTTPAELTSSIGLARGALREPSPSASALENSELSVVVLLLVEPLLDEKRNSCF